MSRMSLRLVPVAALAATTVLAACGSSDSDGGSTATSSTTPAASTSSTTTSAAPTPSTPASLPKTIEPTGDANQALTKPGTKLKFGEPAFIKVQTGTKGSEYSSEAIVKVAVTEIRKGSEKDLAGLKNAEKFKGYTPFYIESTNEIVYFSGNRYSSPTVSLDATGTGQIGKLITFGGFDACKSTRYDFEESGVVGAVRKPCDIGAGRNGGVVTGAKYDGDRSSSDYYKDPITWSK